MKTAPESRTVEFGEIYNRLTQRFMPASVPKQISRKVLAISQVVLAFQHLQDSLRRVVGIFQDRTMSVASLPDVGAHLIYRQDGGMAQKFLSPHDDFRPLSELVELGVG